VPLEPPQEPELVLELGAAPELELLRVAVAANWAMTREEWVEGVVQRVEVVAEEIGDLRREQAPTLD
jgi:hypothetical protein